ncbi:MAG: ABC transporter ATP-binding protein [Pseudohongiella sp.]|nr:MAG: ABC transporter ATP-binding protein [Pseudohongiella sp.]
MAQHFPDRREFREMFSAILSPEAGFYKVVLVYSLAISLLTLAVPISLQLLVDTVANIALLRAVVLIALLLFTLLFLSGVMYALRAYAMELFSRKLYARISSEIAMTAMLAEPEYFEHKQKTDLFNRYFDIVTLKKNIPYILTNGFTLILQSFIGFTVVSFYHFYFFIFSVMLIFLIWLIWRVWGWRAIETSFRLSDSKYQTADWLQSLAMNSASYRSSQNPSYAIENTNRLVDSHIQCQVDHFRNTYAQLIGMLMLYAAASAVLLGIGGWLVIEGELTLGQLVAAELIMSAIFVGLPQMAGYLDSLYYVCAAVEELARFRDVKTEGPENEPAILLKHDEELVFSKVKLEEPVQPMEFNFELPGRGLFRVSGDILCLRRIAELLCRNYRPVSGLITIGGHDNTDIPRQELRKAVRIISRVTVPPMTVREFLNLYIRPEGKYSRQQALSLLRLDDEIAHLSDGLDTTLSRDAWPLSQPQAIKLKLASALLSEPSVLVLEDIVDAVDPHIIDVFLSAMQQLNTIVLYFTKRQDIGEFDYHFHLADNEQSIVKLEKGAAE